MGIRAVDNIMPSYRYRAEVIRCVDGDTLICRCDLGFNIWIEDHPLRLAGCNAPELEPKEPPKAWNEEQKAIWMQTPGFLARKALIGFIFQKSAETYGAYSSVCEEPVVIETAKNQNDKYGRLLATIWVQRKCEICSGVGTVKPDPKRAKADCPACVKGMRWLCVNDMMLGGGFTLPWDGSGIKPV